MINITLEIDLLITIREFKIMKTDKVKILVGYIYNRDINIQPLWPQLRQWVMLVEVFPYHSRNLLEVYNGRPADVHRGPVSFGFRRSPFDVELLVVPCFFSVCFSLANYLFFFLDFYVWLRRASAAIRRRVWLRPADSCHFSRSRHVRNIIRAIIYGDFYCCTIRSNKKY